MLDEKSQKIISMVDEIERKDKLIKVLQECNAELLPYKLFYNHIKAHLPNEQCQVCCKICNKTFSQIIKETNEV